MKTGLNCQRSYLIPLPLILSVGIKFYSELQESKPEPKFWTYLLESGEMTDGFLFFQSFVSLSPSSAKETLDNQLVPWPPPSI